MIPFPFLIGGHFLHRPSPLACNPQPTGKLVSSLPKMNASTNDQLRPAAGSLTQLVTVMSQGDGSYSGHAIPIGPLHPGSEFQEYHFERHEANSYGEVTRRRRGETQFSSIAIVSPYIVVATGPSLAANRASRLFETAMAGYLFSTQNQQVTTPPVRYWEPQTHAPSLGYVAFQDSQNGSGFQGGPVTTGIHGVQNQQAQFPIRQPPPPPPAAALPHPPPAPGLPHPQRPAAALPPPPPAAPSSPQLQGYGAPNNHFWARNAIWSLSR